MAIDTNQLDTRALGAAASFNIGDLHLPLHGVEYGNYGTSFVNSLFDAAKLKQQYALAQQQMELEKQKAQLMADAQLQAASTQAAATSGAADKELQSHMYDAKLKDMQFQHSLGLDRQKLASENQYRSGLLANDSRKTDYDIYQSQLDAQNKTLDMGLKQQEFGLNKQKFAFEQQDRLQDNLMKELEVRMKLSDQQRDMRGAASAAGLVALNSTTDPEQQQKMLSSWGDMQYKKGLYTKDEYETFNNADLTSKRFLLTQDLSMAMKASELAKIPGASDILFGSSSANQPLNKELQKDAQKTISNNTQLVTNLDDIMKTIPPEQFSAAGKSKSTYGNLVEAASSYIPGIENYLPGGTDAKAWADKSSVASAKLSSLANQYVQSLDKSRVSEPFLNFIYQSIPSPKDSPSAFTAKASALRDILQQGISGAQSDLTQGVPVNSQPSSSSVFPNTFSNQSSNATPKSYLYKDPATGNHFNVSDSDLRTIAAQKGVSVDEFLSAARQRGIISDGQF